MTPALHPRGSLQSHSHAAPGSLQKSAKTFPSLQKGQDISSSHLLAPLLTYTHRNTLCLCHCYQARLADIQLKLPALHTEPPWALKIIPLLNRAMRGRLKIHVLFPCPQLQRISGLAGLASFRHPLKKMRTSPSRWPRPKTSPFL